MKLGIKERILLGSILPEKANMSDQIIYKGIRDRIGISSTEAEKINFKSDEKLGVTWDSALAEDISIEFSAPEVNLLKDCVNELDKKKEISFHNLGLCMDIKALEIPKTAEIPPSN